MLESRSKQEQIQCTESMRKNRARSSRGSSLPKDLFQPRPKSFWVDDSFNVIKVSGGKGRKI